MNLTQCIDSGRIADYPKPAGLLVKNTNKVRACVVLI